MDVPFDRANFVFSVEAMLFTTDGRRGEFATWEDVVGEKARGLAHPRCLNDTGRCTQRQRNDLIGK